MIGQIRALLYPRYLANVPQYEPPHEQNELSCTISSIVECEYIAKGPDFERRDFEVMRDEFYDGSFTPYSATALDRAKDTGRIKDWGYISRKEARRHLQKGGQLILGLNDYYKDNRILKKSNGRSGGHAVCAVGYIDVGDGYYIIRNTRGEEGLNGYYLVEEAVVTRLYTFKIK